MVKELEASGKNQTDVTNLLNPLRQLSNKVVGGECGPQLVENNCAICLLLHFLYKEDVNLKSLSSLRFGTVDASLGTEALKVKF